jgi:hypothetical protein
MEVVWRASLAVTSMHAAASMIAGQTLTDAALAAELQPAIAELAAVLHEARAAPAAASEHLCGLAAQIEANRQLADVALTKLVGRSRRVEHVDRMTRAIDAIEAAIAKARPRLAEELPLRVGPLREQWESRGPGLLRLIGAATSNEVLVERAEVLLVEPLTGGGGAAQPLYNNVRIEAVLANSDPRLPEVVRLAWLLSQLQLDLPKFSDGIAPARQREVAALAMLPSVIEAAEQVELMGAVADSLRSVLAAWCGIGPDSLETTAAIVQAWWQTYRETRLPWPAALTALDRMLSSDET